MASKGVYAAYQMLRPIQEDFSDVVNEQEELNARLRREQEAAQEKARQRSENLAKEAGVSLSTLNEVISGVKSIDQANALGVSKARDFMYNIYKEIESDPRKAGNVEYQLKLANARKFADKLSKAQNAYATFAQDFSKGYGDGTYSKWNQGRMDQLSAIFERNDFTIDIDKSGNPVAIVKNKEDDYEKINLVDVLDGRGLGGIVNTYDFDKETTDLADSLGKRLTMLPSGSYEIEEQTFNSHRNQVSKLLDGVLGVGDKPTDVAKSIWADTLGKSKSEFTGSKEDMEEIKQAYMNSVESKYDTLYKKKYDAAKVNAGLRAREQKSTKGLTTVEVRTDVGTGKPLRKGLEGVSGDIGGAATSFSLGNPITFGVGNKEKKINSLYLTDAGQIVYEGEEKTGTKSSTDVLTGEKITEQVFEPVVGGGLNQDEINNLARRIENPDTGKPFRNATELRQHLEEKRGPLSDNKAQDLRKKYNY